MFRLDFLRSLPFTYSGDHTRELSGPWCSIQEAGHNWRIHFTGEMLSKLTSLSVSSPRMASLLHPEICLLFVFNSIAFAMCQKRHQHAHSLAASRGCILAEARRGAKVKQFPYMDLSEHEGDKQANIGYILTWAHSEIVRGLAGETPENVLNKWLDDLHFHIQRLHRVSGDY